jgi:hypothetical protein
MIKESELVKVTIVILEKFIDNGRKDAKSLDISFNEYCEKNDIDIWSEIKEISQKIDRIKIEDDKPDLYNLLGLVIEKLNDKEL